MSVQVTDAWKDKCEQMAADLACDGAVQDIINDKVEVDASQVATTVAAEIVNRDGFDLMPTDAIEAGVAAAIDEIDERTFSHACDALQSRVSAEIEGQAKRIALRMLRELAVKAQREAVSAG